MREAHVVILGNQLVAALGTQSGDGPRFAERTSLDGQLTGGGLGKAKSVEMRPADRGKQQRIRLRGNDAVKALVGGH
jgi:hypothetical protein